MIEVRWKKRQEPLTAEGAYARGPLAAELLRIAKERLLRPRGAAGKDLTVLLGAELPWLDGVRYLARDPDEPRLYLPTDLELSIPAPLAARAFTAQFSLAAPIAVFENTVVSLGNL